MISPEAMMAAIPVLVGAGTAAAPVLIWVGRLQNRVDRAEKDVDLFKAGLKEHMEADTIAHQRIANMEGKFDIALGILERLDARQ